MTAPYIRQNEQTILGNILDRLRILEALAPQLSAAQYEIKLTGDEDEVEAGDFYFNIPEQLDGYSLTYVFAGVWTPPDANIDLTVDYLGGEVGSATISSGDMCGTGTPEPDNQVVECAVVHVGWTGNTVARGLCCVLRFEGVLDS